MIAFESQLKFLLGEIVITDGASQKLSPEEIRTAIRRHGRADWGELDFEDQQLNDLRLQEGGPIASIYKDAAGQKFYVITESDRSVTTVLLAEEY